MLCLLWWCVDCSYDCYCVCAMMCLLSYHHLESSYLDANDESALVIHPYIQWGSGGSSTYPHLNKYIPTLAETERQGIFAIQHYLLMENDVVGKFGEMPFPVPHPHIPCRIIRKQTNASDSCTHSLTLPPAMTYEQRNLALDAACVSISIRIQSKSSMQSKRFWSISSAEHWSNNIALCLDISGNSSKIILNFGLR